MENDFTICLKLPQRFSHKIEGGAAQSRMKQTEKRTRAARSCFIEWWLRRHKREVTDQYFIHVREVLSYSFVLVLTVHTTYLYKQYILKSTSFSIFSCL
jgi:hypothetical protein